MFLSAGLLTTSVEATSFCPFRVTGEMGRASTNPFTFPLDSARLGLGGSAKWKVVDSTVGENRTLLRRFFGCVVSSSSDDELITEAAPLVTTELDCTVSTDKPSPEIPKTPRPLCSTVGSLTIPVAEFGRA